MEKAPRWKSILFWLAVVALVLCRPIFVVGIPFAAHPATAYDDGLFMRLAIELRNGNWLGSYDLTTLCKGPFYPMFVAAARECLVPLSIFEQVFYTAIALIAAWSVRPVVTRRWLLLAGLALLILNPYSWGPLPSRLTRDPMAGQLALLTFAAVVGLILRRGRGLADLFTWGGLAGVAGAACWMTREEAIWIIGPAAVLLLAAVIILWREARPDRFMRAGVMIFVPLVAGVLPVLSVCEQNRQHYGLFAVVDLKSREFQDAYGALLRVGQKYYRHHVPVPAPAREAMYEVSPSFRELRPLLEGEVGQKWMFHRPMPDPQDMQGGWFIWAFREAAQQASGRSDVPPLALYRKIADEINAACDAGTIPAGPKRSGLATPLNRNDVQSLARKFAGNLWALLVWPEYRVDRFGWDDSSERALVERDLVQTPLTGPQHQYMVEGWACASDGPVTLALLQEDGSLAKFKPAWLISPDVDEYLRAGDKNWASAGACRFSHYGTKTATHLLVFRGDREMGRVPLRQGAQMFLTESAAASIDSFTTDPVPVMPRPKQIFQRFLGLTTCFLAAPLMLMTLAWLALGLIAVRRSLLWICITGALAGAIVVREGLLAYIDATTYAVFDQRYAEPTYTALAFLFFLSACGLWQHLVRRAPSPERPSPEHLAQSK